MMRMWKTAGPDDIPGQALLADLDESVEMLCPLNDKIWEEEQIQQDCKEEYLVKIPEKGELVVPATEIVAR